MLHILTILHLYLPRTHRPIALKMLRFGIFVFSALLVAFQAAAASLPFNGADISSLPLLESQGISYKDGGQTKPFETILTQHGFHVARIRIWTAGTYTQQYAINLAKRAKNAGMKVLIDLHYSDTCKCDTLALDFVTEVSHSRLFFPSHRGRPWTSSQPFWLAH